LRGARHIEPNVPAQRETIPPSRIDNLTKKPNPTSLSVKLLATKFPTKNESRGFRDV
jgi:hypothetical protein